ncbi:MAG TPA: hypothetical protein VHB77_15185 [Planctomycetaceae bacterium]|nr:hypothetical protein [Planctomycetaceae bacterium]
MELRESHAFTLRRQTVRWSPKEILMARGKRKLTPEKRRARRRRKELYELVFIHGKQKWVRRAEPLIGGIPASEFIAGSADPVWLMQNGCFELLPAEDRDVPKDRNSSPLDEIPF